MKRSRETETEGGQQPVSGEERSLGSQAGGQWPGLSQSQARTREQPTNGSGGESAPAGSHQQSFE